MKKLILLSACLWALGSSPILAQTGGPQLVLVSTVDYDNLHIVICRGADKSEVVDVPYKALKQNPNAKVEAIQGVLAKLLAEGYSLTSSTSAGDHYVYRGTFIFTKPQ